MLRSTWNDLGVTRMIQSTQNYVFHPDVTVSDILLLKIHSFGLCSLPSAFSVGNIRLIHTEESKGYVPTSTSLLAMDTLVKIFLHYF